MTEEILKLKGEKIADEERMKEAEKVIGTLRGMLKGKHTTDEELHRIREKVVEEMDKEFK